MPHGIIMTRAVLSMSGGLDSVAAWWAFGKPDWFFVTDANRGASKIETVALSKIGDICPDFKASGKNVALDCAIFQSPRGGCYPRSYVLAMVAVGLGFEEVLFAFHSWDNPKFELLDREITNFIRYNYQDGSLSARNITAEMGRVDLLKRARSNGCPDRILLETWSCHNDNKKHCGICFNCMERFVALTLCNVPCDHQFETVPIHTEARDDTLVRAHNLGCSDFLKHYRELVGVPPGKPIFI